MRLGADVKAANRELKGPVRFAQTLLRAAVTLKRIAAVPQLPKGYITDAKKLPSAPTLADVERIIAKARGWVQIALALGVYAGLRSGEIRALEVGDLDFEGEVIRVIRTLSVTTPLDPKGKKHRMVGMAPQLAAILGPATKGKAPGTKVVLNARGKSPKRQAVYNAFVATQRRMGLRRAWGVHAMRHAFCSHLVRAGVSLKAVQDLAGHSSLAVTNRYVHAVAMDLKDAVKKGFGRHDGGAGGGS
jgi:integrase